jgi:hypothetical protein
LLKQMWQWNELKQQKQKPQLPVDSAF